MQIYSRKYHISFDAGFFGFIRDNWENKSLRDRLTVLMKSANNLVSDLNESEKFLVKVGLYNLPYDSLKDRYLAAFEEGDPSLFRSLIARYYKDRVMDLWLALMQRQGSAPVDQESKYDEEFAHLSSLFLKPPPFIHH